MKNNSDFIYGYGLSKKDFTYTITVYSQLASAELISLKLFEDEYKIDSAEQIVYKNESSYGNLNNVKGDLCEGVTNAILEDLGKKYKALYGIKPGISSSLKGLQLIVGYMLCPFNVNFYKISKHFNLNPNRMNFTPRSHGDSPDAEDFMFKSLNIKPTRMIRKTYQENPESVICYAGAKTMGFTDVNILQKSVSHDFYKFITSLNTASPISKFYLNKFEYFTNDVLRFNKQLTVWNSVERIMKIYNEKHKSWKEQHMVIDAIWMYKACSEFLSEQEKKKIMEEGFNQYTHDFLTKRSNQLESLKKEKMLAEEKIAFNLEKEFLDLEYKSGNDTFVDEDLKEEVPVNDRDRWCFYVARDWGTLKKIGSEMGICVGWGGYKEAVQERRSTIVYALYKDSYKICIEVTPDFSIRQAVGPRNVPLTGDSLIAYLDWCRQRNLKITQRYDKALYPPRG